MGYRRTCPCTTKRSRRDDTEQRPGHSSRSTSGRFVPSNVRPHSPGGTPMFPAATRISRPRKTPKTASTPHSATTPASTGSRRSRLPSSADPTLARQIDVLYLLYLEKQVDPELLKQITAKANSHRKDLQRLSRQRERPHDHRQRSAAGPQGITRPGRSQGRLGREQGGRSARRARLEGTGQTPQPGRPQAGLRRLSQTSASS